MKILYGTKQTYIDVTEICFNTLNFNNIITIPFNDTNRASYFSDPLYGTLKSIYININGTITEYNDNFMIKINIITNEITTYDMVLNNDMDNKLYNIHSTLKINHGNLNEEVPEQKMVVRYLTGNEKVLEIGGNIGRNSLVIASILNDNTQFVTLESDENIAKQLIENRDLNSFSFNIENAALSKRKLIQKDWNTYPSEILLDEYKWVNTIGLQELNNKYNIAFDTLVIDCEGALYYILMDMPEILNNIKLIIMENDYFDLSHKQYIDTVLKNNNFYVDYVEGGGWGPCYTNFYEVWKK
jgi:FkbM family methyltransferase